MDRAEPLPARRSLDENNLDLFAVVGVPGRTDTHAPERMQALRGGHFIDISRLRGL